MDSVFYAQDYKDFIKERVSLSRGESSRLAEACGCEKSYLSRVLSTEVHITPDHAYRMTEYWQLSTKEQECFLLLVEEARCADPSFRRYLKSKLQKLKNQHQEVKNFTAKSEVQESLDEAWYNSNILNCAIHLLTSLPNQTAYRISERLNTSTAVTETILKKLESLGYISQKKGTWSYVKGAGHLDRHSPLVTFHHTNWRNRAMADMMNTENDSIHYTNVQSLSFDDFEKIKQMILTFIHNSNSVMNPSKSEELICLNIDYFRV